MVIIIMSFRIAFKLLKLIVNYYNMYYYSLIINITFYGIMINNSVRITMVALKILHLSDMSNKQIDYPE